MGVEFFAGGGGEEEIDDGVDVVIAIDSGGIEAAFEVMEFVGIGLFAEDGGAGVVGKRFED